MVSTHFVDFLGAYLKKEDLIKFVANTNFVKLDCYIAGPVHNGTAESCINEAFTRMDVKQTGKVCFPEFYQ